jgi:hypothetical protein
MAATLLMRKLDARIQVQVGQVGLKKLTDRMRIGANALDYGMPNRHKAPGNYN